MEKLRLDIREKVLFIKEARLFTRTVQDVLALLEEEVRQNAERACDYARLAADISIDLHSYLLNWVLIPAVERELLDVSAIEEAADAFLAFATKIAGSALRNESLLEIDAVKNSQTAKISLLHDAGQLNTVYGHDFAYGLSFGLRRGARWVTSNPAKIALYEKDLPHEFQQVLRTIKREQPGINVDDFTSQVFTKICAQSARELRPIFELTGGEYGFVCVQVSPLYIHDPEKMIAQADFWYEAFKKELDVEQANIVFKLPAVRFGMAAAEALVAKGYRICMTLNFSVAQHEIFGNIIQKGGKTGYVVFMGGYLDDAVRKDLLDQGQNEEEAALIARHASEAVIRKSYANLKSKNLDKVAIMTAAVRGPWSMINSLVPAGGPPVLITTTKENVNVFDSMERELRPVIDQEPDPAMLEKLKKSDVFMKAYADLKDSEDFFANIESYPPMMNVQSGFCNNYEHTMKAVEDILCD